MRNGKIRIYFNLNDWYVPPLLLPVVTNALSNSHQSRLKLSLHYKQSSPFLKVVFNLVKVIMAIYSGKWLWTFFRSYTVQQSPLFLFCEYRIFWNTDTLTIKPVNSFRSAVYRHFCSLPL